MPAQAWVTLIVGLVAIVGVLVTWRQKNTADRRSEWWRRTAWAFERSLSDDNVEAELEWKYCGHWSDLHSQRRATPTLCRLLATMRSEVRAASTQEIDMTDEAAREPDYRWPLEVRRAAAQAVVAASKKTGRPVHPLVKELAEEADRLEGMMFVEEQAESVRQRIGRYFRDLFQVSE